MHTYATLKPHLPPSYTFGLIPPLDSVCMYYVDDPYVCNACHDLTMLAVNTSDTAIITVKNVDYHCIFIALANLKQKNY